MWTDEMRRQLVDRFLRLPYRHAIAVTRALGVIDDVELKTMHENKMMVLLFQRAVERGLLAQLWDEVEQRHADPAQINPFRESG